MAKPLPGSAESLSIQARKSKAQVKREHDQKLQDMMLRRAVKRALALKDAAIKAKEKAAEYQVIAAAAGLVFGKPSKPKSRKKRK